MNPKQKSNQLFKKIEAGAVLLKASSSVPDSSIRYFTGLQQGFLSSNILLLKPGKRPLLLKSLLEPKISIPGLRILNINRQKQLKSILRKELKGVKTLAINKPL